MRRRRKKWDVPEKRQREDEITTVVTGHRSCSCETQKKGMREKGEA